MEKGPGSDMMQESLSRTKSFYSSMHAKLQQAEPECNPEMIIAQDNEAVRAGRPPKRSPSRQNYAAINQAADLPGTLKVSNAPNPDGWASKLGASAGNSMAQNLWHKAEVAKQGVSGMLSSIAAQAQQQRAGVKETLDELDACLTTELFLGDCPAVGPSERRVLVHASVWEKFMSKFKMYRPLLSRIKSEYEMVLHQYSQQLHVLNATQFKVAAENLVKSEEHLEMKNKHLDEIACLRSKLDSLTKDKKSEGDSIEKITEMVDHWKLQASTRVPIIKLQMCEAECVELSASLAAETTAHNNTKADLQSAYAELNRRNEDAERALKQLSGMTPRPDWMEISTSVPELAEAFRKSENSADRLEKMESLLKKSTAAMKKAQKKKATGRKKAKPGAFDYFTGMGMAKDIPEYLRTNGRVRNNHLTKGACEDLVKECWAEKQRYDDTQGKKSKLSAFFPLFLAEKCGQDQVIEQAYNMWFALRDYSYDADCDLFCRIVQGKMDEEVYTDQMSMLDALKQQFKDHDKLLNGESTGKLPKEALKAVFGDFFPVKSDKEVKDCFKQLDKEHPGAVVGYEGIFEEDAEGNQGDFIEGVRDQHLSDREEYIESIEDALWDQDTQDSGEISYSQLLEAFKSFDPDKPTEEVADIAVRSLGCPAKSLKPNKVLAIPAFLKTVQGMSVHRRTKKPS